jgi:hypothetical protein
MDKVKEEMILPGAGPCKGQGCWCRDVWEYQRDYDIKAHKPKSLNSKDLGGGLLESR